MDAENKGIIVGSDDTQEWILPWWWKNYRKFNTHPVTFIDFGMTDAATTWCKKRGSVLKASHLLVAEKHEINPEIAAAWENLYGKEFWPQRNGWFKKPLACQLSPYDRTIWIDLDCEVRGPIDPLFHYADHPSGISLSKDIYEGYNSGVIVFKKGHTLLQHWVQWSTHKNHLYAGDQDILTRLIAEHNLSIPELPEIYNWSRIKGRNTQAVIYHWHGRYGKMVISMQTPR